jgi:hypothetical protein
MGVVSQDCPTDTGHLVCHCHCGFIFAAFGHYTIDPLAQTILSIACVNDHRSCTID